MRVNLVTGISGFPFGTANAKRIYLVGKSIQASGHDFRVFTNSIQYNEFNTNTEGVYKDIVFKYLHRKQLKSNLSKIIKILYFIKGCGELFKLIRTFDHQNDIIYSYNHGNFFNVYIILLCKLFNIRLIQEINEWYHNDLNRGIEKFITESILAKYSQGALVISGEIEKKITGLNPGIKTLRIPVLEEFASRDNIADNHFSEGKYCFWMGDVDGYLKDVLFTLKACSEVLKSGISIKFFISGPYSTDSFTRISEVATEFNYPVENIKLFGYLPEDELKFYCNNAFIFVVPLWNDERSKSRFPTKMASFMQAGKPVLTCKIGEISELLTDLVNVIYYKENDYVDLADKMLMLFNNQVLYTKISEESSHFAEQNFNYLSYRAGINNFLNNL